MPVIPIPLRPEDSDAPLDLQRVLEVAYDRAAYDLEINYAADPNPPLPDPYGNWARDLVEQSLARRT